MDLVEELYKAFKKYKTDPEEYLTKKDRNKDGNISVVDFKHIIFDFCKLAFSQKEVETLIRRYEHPAKKDQISLAPLQEDLRDIKKKEVPEEIKMEKPSKSILNSKTPISSIKELKFSNRHPTNIPGWKSYSMKNTSCGRIGANKKYPNIDLYKHKEILEEIMKQTFINDKLVQDHFQEFTKHSDVEFSEFKKATDELNLQDIEEEEIRDLYDDIRAKDRRAQLEDIDIAVQCTVKRNIQECQKLILDDVYSSIKSDPKLTYQDIFSKYEATASNKITFHQFVTILEPKCLNIEPSNLILLAKRYCTKYDDEVYYKDLIKDLEKLATNIDPTKEWLEEVCINVQKALVCKNESLYEYFCQFTGKNDRMQEDDFNKAMRSLQLDEIYNDDVIHDFYYYCDDNKSGVVSIKELQNTVRKYCIKDRTEFIEDILDSIYQNLKKKDITFDDFEEDIERLSNPRDKTKFIRAKEIRDLLIDDLRLDLNIIDEQLLFFHFKDRSDARYFNYGKFLDKMNKVFKSHRGGGHRKTQSKDINTLDFKESEIREILKRINAKVEEHKINLESKAHKYDPDQRLREEEFYTIFSMKDLDLTKNEQTALFNKYFNTMDNAVYVDQLLIDLKKYYEITPAGKSKADPKILKKIAHKCKKEHCDTSVIKECFMADKHEDGLLSQEQIKKAFHNGGMKISTTQCEGLLQNSVADKNHNHDYVKLLTEMFGEKEVRRYKDRMRRSSGKKRTPKTKDRRERDRHDERLGTRKSSRGSSRASSRGSLNDSMNSRDSRASSRHSERSKSGRKTRERPNRRNPRDHSRNPQVSSLEKDDDRSESLNPRGRGASSKPRGRETSLNPRERSTSLNPRDKSKSAYNSSSRSPARRKNDDRGLSKSKREDSLNARSKSRTRDFDNSEYSDTISQEKSLNRSKSYGRESNSDDSDRGAKSRGTKSLRNKDSLKTEPKKSNLKRHETTSITRNVGVRIRNSKEDVIKAFKRSNGNHPSKLITDKELLRALKDLDITLEYGDEKKLFLEIDTQKIRNTKRMFNYEHFLEKAGVDFKSTIRSQKSVDLKLTSNEIREAEDEIYKIKKELKHEDITLYQMLDLKISAQTTQWTTFIYALEDNLPKYWIDLSSNKDRLAILKLYLVESDEKTIEVKRLNKVFGIDTKLRKNSSEEDKLFEEEDDFKGDERLNKTAGKSSHKSQLNYSDEEEDDYDRRRSEKRRFDESKKYEKDTLQLDDRGRMNMAVNNLLQDLKTKEIDFNKNFVNKSGVYTDQEFSSLLQKIEYNTKDTEEFDNLRAAFRDDKDRNKISVKRIKYMFNTIDPTYLNKDAIKSAQDAKIRLGKLSEDVKESITRIDNFFKRHKHDIRQVFKRMDIDKDGTISEKEWTRVLLKTYRIPGFDVPQLEKVFQQLDMNKSKSLTIGELMYFLEGAKRTEEDRKKQMSKDVKDQLLFDIHKLFEEFDTENKGYITDKDLHQILKASGIYIDRNQCKEIIKDNGGRTSGHMSKRDFEDVMMEKMVKELIEDEDSINDLNSMFHQADINKDGYLTIDELDIMFKQYNTNITYDDLLGLMKEIDVDGDGRLDIDEFLALMTLDHESFKNSSSGNTLMKMKKSAKTPAYNFAKYFKILPSQFVESFTTRLWKRKQNLPSSVFEPKINPDTLLYKDLRKDMRPTEKDYPLLAFQILLVDATGVPYPKPDPKKKEDLKVVKREVRVSMFNNASSQYIANSACVSSIHDPANPDKWKFNPWKSVGPNPLIFTSKEKSVVDSDQVDLIFEFVIVCKGDNEATKDISCGFAALPLKKLKGKTRPKYEYLDIQGGSPDQPIAADPFDFQEGMGMWKKMKRGTIKSRIKLDLRYFDQISKEGKFYISMLPATCVINKKLLHFLAGYRCYQAKTL